MIRVDIVTPVKMIVEGVEVPSLKIPAHYGEIEVLPNHTELVASLCPGVLSFEHDGKLRRFAISHGFAEVLKDRVVILAETCEESHEIDKDRAIESIKKSQEMLGSVITRDDFRKYERKLRRAKTRQETTEL